MNWREVINSSVALGMIALGMTSGATVVEGGIWAAKYNPDAKLKVEMENGVFKVGFEEDDYRDIFLNRVCQNGILLGQTVLEQESFLSEREKSGFKGSRWHGVCFPWGKEGE